MDPEVEDHNRTMQLKKIYLRDNSHLLWEKNRTLQIFYICVSLSLPFLFCVYFLPPLPFIVNTLLCS